MKRKCFPKKTNFFYFYFDKMEFSLEKNYSFTKLKETFLNKLFFLCYSKTT